MRSSVVVRSVSVGQDGPQPDPIQFEWGSRSISVRELIKQAARINVELAIAQHEARSAPREKPTHLSEEAIEEMAALGKIRLGSDDETSAPSRDAEVKRALRAFSEGRFLITVNEYQPMSLDEQVTLTENTEVTFVRLMPLIGG